MKKILLLIAPLLLCIGAFAQQPANEVQINGNAIATGNGVSGTGVQRVAIVSDNTAFSVNATLQTGANTVGKFDLLGNAGAILDFAGQNAASPANSILIGGQFNTTPSTITSGNSSPLQVDNLGKLLVNCTGCSAGSTVGLVPQTSGGLTMTHAVTGASTNAAFIKASAGQVYEACFNNNAAYPIYLKLYNKASAPTVGTDTVVKAVMAQAGVPTCMRTENGFAFSTGIAYATTKLLADADTTAVLAGDGSIEIASK